MTKSSKTGQKRAKYWAFEDEDEPNLLNILLNWLGEIGYTTIRQNNLGDGPQVFDVLWEGHDTEARLEVYGEEVVLYTRETHPSLRAGIYDSEAFGTLKRFLENYAKAFENGGNVFPGHYKI